MYDWLIPGYAIPLYQAIPRNTYSYKYFLVSFMSLSPFPLFYNKVLKCIINLWHS